MTYQPIYDNITSTVGCANSADSLACLRKSDYQALYEAFAPFVLTPVLDGKFLSRLPSESFDKGLVADVAVLTGSNTDEGTATFFGPRGTLHNDSDVEQFLSKLGRGLTGNTVKTLKKLYPDDPFQECPFHTGAERFANWGAQYKRGATIVGDMAIQAGRRFTAKYFTNRARRTRKPVYSYRFDQSPWNNSLDLIATEPPVYATHYAEICFVFNLDPHDSRNNSNWIGPYPEYHVLAAAMSKSWISFVHSLNPNVDGNGELPHWPDYSSGHQNLVLRTRGSFVEKDNWRSDQLDYWGHIWGQLGT
jgi:carboxylesterase type B